MLYFKLEFRHFLEETSYVSWGGVRLSPLCTSANVWPILPAPDDR
jgi:hypothetical protein